MNDTGALSWAAIHPDIAASPLLTDVDVYVTRPKV
jgi:hypothetical protein